MLVETTSRESTWALWTFWQKLHLRYVTIPFCEGQSKRKLIWKRSFAYRWIWKIDEFVSCIWRLHFVSDREAYRDSTQHNWEQALSRPFEEKGTNKWRRVSQASTKIEKYILNIGTKALKQTGRRLVQSSNNDNEDQTTLLSRAGLDLKQSEISKICGNCLQVS